MRLLDRVLAPFKRKSLTHTADEGWMDTSWDQGWWQQNKRVEYFGTNATVEACINALAQTAAMCPLHHMKQEQGQGQERIWGSNVERVLLNPNRYENGSQFIVNALRSVYYEGNAYAVALRNSVGTIRELHLVDPRSTRGYLDPETGDVYYHVTTKQNQPVAFDSEESRVFGARDVLHLRLHTDPRDPLRGVTPLTHAAASISANNAMTSHQASFYQNMSRPSGILSSDLPLKLEQIRELRRAFEEQAKKLDSGGIPVLGGGMKFQPLTLSSQDSQLVEAYSMSVADIARAFRVPLILVNDYTNATFNNAEQTMQFFLSSGLGFVLNQTEQSLTRLFSLPFGEHTNFDTDVLMRTDFKGMMEALSTGTVGGILSPDEARAKVKLPAAPGGHGVEPRVQQQVQPLSAWDAQQELAQAAAEDPQPTESEEELDPAAVEEMAFQALEKSYLEVVNG